MDANGYGRYIDETDGLPRWRLPPRGSRPRGLRWKLTGEAIRELYPDRGGRFVADRLGMPSKYVNVTRYAAMFGVKVTRERRRKGYEEMTSRLRRIYRMERGRVMVGLPQVTRMNLGQKGYVATPPRFYALRNRFVKVYGYYYCEDDVGVLLYDDKTRRHLPGSTPPNGFTEEMVTERYGIKFEPADDRDDETDNGF